MSAKLAAAILGLIFIAVGVLGFLPNPVVAPTGIFVVNEGHNAVHIVTGLALLAGAYLWGNATLTLLIIGGLYAAVAILGFVMPGNMLLGFVAMNDADRWLHVALAIVVLAAGWRFS